MENFQLYRTNLLLGGQMKWDILLESSNSTLYVSDFHLSPISNNVPYTHKSDERLINNAHTDNVKLFYNSVKGNFYSEGLDTIFNHSWPVLCKQNEILNSYSNVYDMGCKRMKSYSLYKKQFEFFCPLWIEKLENEIEFRFVVKTKNSDAILSSKRLVLNKSHNSSYSDYHDKFAKYFNDYIKSSKLNEGDDDLLKIIFKNRTTNIYGLDVSTGLFVNKSIDFLVNNLLSRERPLLEADNMLMQSFSNNNIIAKQLFNFNFCFDLEDIMSDNIINMLSGENIFVSIEVYVDGNKLEKRDFYTNYEFIERCYQGKDKNVFNVLDYLHDNKSLSLLNKNKFCQSICHWSLVDNKDYIFNVYEGFSGIRMENGAYFENSHQYGDTSNLNTFHVSSANEITWITGEKITTWNAFYKYIANTDKYKKNGAFFYDKEFVNGIKYKNLPKIETENHKGIYIVGLHITRNVMIKIMNNLERFELICIPINDTLYLLRKDNLLMLITTKVNDLTYKRFYNILISEEKNIYDTVLSLSANIQNEKIYIDALYEIMKNVISPEVLKFDGGLLWTTVTGPTKDVSEVEYLKDNTITNYILRYDGKLKPTFISEPKNVIYYKDYVSDIRKDGTSNLIKSKYNNYLCTGFEPNYPSIGYCAMNKIESYNYNSLPIGNISEHGEIPILNDIEYSWFNTNVCIYLESKLTFVYENKKSEGLKTLDEILKEYISSYYNVNDERHIEYIVSKYNISSNWDYKSPTNIEDYIYDITLELK